MSYRFVESKYKYNQSIINDSKSILFKYSTIKGRLSVLYSDYPMTVSKAHHNKDIIAIALGSAGSRIASRLSLMKTIIDKFYFISCDKQDLINNSESSLLIPLDYRGKNTPANVRGAAIKFLPKIEEIINRSKIVFIISGLGGSVGSGLATLVSDVIKKNNATCLCIAAMPHSFESNKHFQSAIALRRLNKSADAVIVVDNDDLSNDLVNNPILDTYEIINEKIAFVIGKILGLPQKGELHIDLSKLSRVVLQQGISVLGIGQTHINEAPEEAVSKAVRMIYDTVDPNETENALFFLSGSKGITTGDIECSTKQIRSLLGDQSLNLEYGLSTNSNNSLTAIILASGFNDTKFSKYDPIDTILGKNNRIDDSSECEIELDLDKLSRLD